MKGFKIDPEKLKEAHDQAVKNLAGGAAPTTHREKETKKDKSKKPTSSTSQPAASTTTPAEKKSFRRATTHSAHVCKEGDASCVPFSLEESAFAPRRTFYRSACCEGQFGQAELLHGSEDADMLIDVYVCCFVTSAF